MSIIDPSWGCRPFVLRIDGANFPVELPVRGLIPHYSVLARSQSLHCPLL